MQIPLEVTFRNLPKDPAIEDLIYDRADKLDRICDYIISCRVAIEQRQKNQNSGMPYRVRIDIKVPPGHEIVVSRDPSKGNLHLDLAAEVRWAFDAAERKLNELTDRQKGDVKTHPFQEVQGVILSLFPEQDYGFIQTIDGRELYFHKNSLLHYDFARLEPGLGVSFTEEMGEAGPQASSIQVVERPNSM